MRIGVIVKAAIILMAIFLCPSLLLAKREHAEKWYQERWCREQGGQIEVVLPDRTRCDCVTDILNPSYHLWRSQIVTSNF